MKLVLVTWKVLHYTLLEEKSEINRNWLFVSPRLNFRIFFATTTTKRKKTLRMMTALPKLTLMSTTPTNARSKNASIRWRS